MIRLHEFNTAWYGQPAGIVDDAAFFSLPAGDRESALAPYRWAEFKAPLDQAPPLRDLQAAGFFLADTQEEFRIALKPAQTPSDCDLQMQFARNVSFELEDRDLAPFAQERYQHLPGITPDRINQRYGLWARLLIRRHPDCCLRGMAEGAVQGWFLSQPAGNGLNLTLAMLHRDAKISGFLLYQNALACYAGQGHRVGWASFSVRNTAVHNIYSKLGARFVPPTGIWLWVK